jgi:hypothetical protein
VSHESINKWGFASHPIKFDFDYLVSIKQNRLGLLTVDEYRDSHYLPAEFPDGIATTGLPALVLIFHPHYVQNFKISCEGLARSKGGPAWQMYFRQRPDKPNTIRTYQIGAEGQAYPVALKGARGLRQTAFRSSGWKRISSTLCHKSAWSPTTQPSSMVQCISNPATWTCGCLRMLKFITIGEAGAVTGDTVSGTICFSPWTTINGSRRPRPQARRIDFLKLPRTPPTLTCSASRCRAYPIRSCLVELISAAGFAQRVWVEMKEREEILSRKKRKNEPCGALTTVVS